jgi:hypothetical protein
MNRRQFLRIGLYGLLAAGATTYVGLTQCQDQWGAMMVRRQFPELTIADADLARFLEDYQVHYGELLPEGLDHLYRTFLLSTNFFQQDLDGRGEVEYMNLYHPYASPCYNPLAQLQLQDPSEE